MRSNNEYDKIEDFRGLYLNAREHEFRQTGNKSLEKSYYTSLGRLFSDLETFIYYKIDDKDRTPEQKLFLQLFHDNISHVRLLNYYTTKDSDLSDKNDRLIVVEQYLQLAHSVLDGRKVKFGYNFYTGSGYLGVPGNEMRKSKMFVNTDNKIERALTQSEINIIIKKHEDLCSTKPESEYYKDMLDWAKTLIPYSDDRNIYKDE